jgi:hypothetical protein
MGNAWKNIWNAVSMVFSAINRFATAADNLGQVAVISSQGYADRYSIEQEQQILQLTQDFPALKEPS